MAVISIPTPPRSTIVVLRWVTIVAFVLALVCAATYEWFLFSVGTSFTLAAIVLLFIKHSSKDDDPIALPTSSKTAAKIFRWMFWITDGVCCIGNLVCGIIVTANIGRGWGGGYWGPRGRSVFFHVFAAFPFTVCTVVHAYFVLYPIVVWLHEKICISCQGTQAMHRWASCAQWANCGRCGASILPTTNPATTNHVEPAKARSDRQVVYLDDDDDDKDSSILSSVVPLRNSCDSDVTIQPPEND